MLNKIKYGIIVTFVFQALKMFLPDLEIPEDIEPAINSLIESVVIIVPWVVAFFTKESKETLKTLTLK
jgi:hypothetical protein